MATKTPNEYKAAHTTGYTAQKLGFDNRRPFNMGLRSQQSAESPFKAKFEPHMMYKGSDEVMANTYEKHLELKNKGYGHTKPKSPAKMKDVKLKGKKLPKGYTKKDKKFLEEQNEDVVRYEDLDEKGKAIWRSQGKKVPAPTKLFKKRKARRALREEKYGTKSRRKARKITGNSRKSQKVQESLDAGKKSRGESVNMSNRDYAEKHLGYRDDKSPAKFVRTGGTRHGKKSKWDKALEKGTQKVIEHGFTKLYNQAKGVKKVYDYLKGTPKGSAATGLTKKKSPTKKKDNIGEGYMNAPYRSPEGKGPRANRKDLSYHGYTNFTSNVTGKKVHKDGPKVGTNAKTGNWQPANRVKSVAEKKVIAKKKEYDAMTPAQKKAAQDKANAKRKAFENSPEYKKRKEKQMSKN